MAGFGIGGSASKNKSKTKSSQDNWLDDWSKAQYGSLSGQVQNQIAGPAQAYGGQLSAGANPFQTQAANNVSGMSYTPQNVTANPFTSADISKYMDPNLDLVMNRTLGDIDEARRMQRVGDSQQATAMGAWGGSRHGVADSLTNDRALDAAADASASLRSNAFNQAAGLWQADEQRRLAAEGMNTANQQFGAQFGLNRNAMLGQMGAQLQGQDQAGLDRQYADFNRLYEDPFKRSQVLLSLLQGTPMITDSSGTSKTTATNMSLSAGWQQA